MSKNQEYAAQYAEAAMEQMRRYGIPASVTLAQGIIESSNGQSQLARNENNHFGIKATSSWIAGGGKYGLYTDDRPDEKFCSYANVDESYEHHSRFLKQNKRYGECFSLRADNYKGWAWGLDKAGYATAGKYAPNLIKIIEQNDLDKYDRMVMEEMQAQGRSFGTEQKPRTIDSKTLSATNSNVVSTNSSTGYSSASYAFPLKRESFLLVTSPFGMRTDPMNSHKQQMHKGIDIQTRQDDVLATENHGKVVAVNANAQTTGGKSVILEYQRENGERYRVSYLHLSSIDVKTGDVVNAGQKVGVSGNTGTRTTGEHLHIGVKQIASDGTARDVDPAAYLTDIAQKGNIRLQVLSNGENLLTKYRDAPVNGNLQMDTSLSPEDWMKKLLSSEDSGVNLPQGDPILSLATTLFTSLMALAMQIDGKSEQEKMQTATDAAMSRQVDLSALMPSLKKCKLTVDEDGKMSLQMNDGKNDFTHVLTAAETSRLQNALSNAELTDDEKRQRIVGITNHILLGKQASMNYEQGANQEQEQKMQIR